MDEPIPVLQFSETYEEEYAAEDFEADETVGNDDNTYSARFDDNIDDATQKSSIDLVSETFDKGGNSILDDEDPFSDGNNNDDDDPFSDNNKPRASKSSTKNAQEDDPFAESDPFSLSIEPKENKNTEDDDPFGDEPKKKGGDEGDEEEEEEEVNIEGMDLEVYMTSVMPVESLDRGDPSLPEEERYKHLDPMFRPLVGMSPLPGQPRLKWAVVSFDKEDSDDVFAEEPKTTPISKEKSSVSSSSSEKGKASSANANNSGTKRVMDVIRSTSKEYSQLLGRSRSMENKFTATNSEMSIHTSIGDSLPTHTADEDEDDDGDEGGFEEVEEDIDGNVAPSSPRSNRTVPALTPRSEPEVEDMSVDGGGGDAAVPRGLVDKLQREIAVLKAQLAKSKLQFDSNGRSGDSESVGSEVTNLKSYASTLQKNIRQANNMLAVEALLKGIDLAALSTAGRQKKNPAPPLHPSGAGNAAGVKKGRSLMATSDGDTAGVSPDVDGATSAEKLAHLQKELRRRDEKLSKAEGMLSIVATACLDLKKQVKALHKIIRTQEAELQAKDMRAPKKSSKDIPSNSNSSAIVTTNRDKDDASSAATRRSSRERRQSDEDKRPSAFGEAVNKGRVAALEERLEEMQVHVKEMRTREKELVDQVLSLTHKNDALLIQIKRSLTSSNKSESTAPRKYSQPLPSVTQPPGTGLSDHSDGPQDTAHSTPVKWAKAPKGVPPNKAMQSPKRLPPTSGGAPWEERFDGKGEDGNGNGNGRHVSVLQEAKAVLRSKEKDNVDKKRTKSSGEPKTRLI